MEDPVVAPCLPYGRWCTTPAVAKKSRNRPVTPGIAEQIIQKLKQTKQASVVDLGLFRQAREFALQQRGEASEDLSDLHPFHAAATYVLKTVVSAGNLIGELPELAKLMERIEAAEDEYVPDGPPMSPITRSYFLCWTLFDLGIGLKNETLGTCVAAISKAMGSDAGYVDFVQRLCKSRPGLFVCEGKQGEAFVLRELVTGTTCPSIIPSGYEAAVGDLLLLRLLPPLEPFRHALVLTTPYLIRKPGLAAWEAYLKRAPKAGPDPVVAYENLMKHGTAPHGPKHWQEYIFEAYSGDDDGVIYLEGLPDVGESRPHSSVDEGQVAPTTSVAAGKIVRTLPLAELTKLPKLSATLLEFSESFMGGVPPGTTLAQMREGMAIVELMWNAPVLMRHGDARRSSELKQVVEERFSQLPHELRATLEGLLRDRSTIYGYDPRLATVRVIDDGKGGFTVEAEARLVDGAPEGWRGP